MKKWAYYNEFDRDVISNQVPREDSAFDQGERDMWDTTPIHVPATCNFLNCAIVRFVHDPVCVQYPKHGFLHMLRISSGRLCCVYESEGGLNRAVVFLWHVAYRAVRGRGYAGATPSLFLRFAPFGSYPNTTIFGFDRGRAKTAFRNFCKRALSLLGERFLCVSTRTRQSNTDLGDLENLSVWERLTYHSEGRLCS